MKLAMTADGRYACCLCDYDFRDADPTLGRDRILAHLCNVHHRTMIAEQQGTFKGVTTWTGPNWKNDEAR